MAPVYQPPTAYQLPQKQIDRAARRQQYDMMKHPNPLPQQIRGVTVAVANAAAATAATAAVQQQQIIMTHSAADVAALPLLQPFQIKKPAESSIINTIINEQHAADTLAAVLKQEGKLQKDLQKAKSENAKEAEKNNDKIKAAAAAAATATGNNNNKATTTKKSKKFKKNNSNNVDSAKVKEIESKIETIALTIQQCRLSLSQFAGWTKAMLQAEYSKLAVTLDPDSSRYVELESSFSFLCPRLNTAEGPEDYYHEQRIAYVKEMIPVMKKVGEKNVATSLVALPYIQKFQCDEPENPIVAALIDEMHQLAITEGVRVNLEKQMGDPAKFKVLKHAEERLDLKEIATSELVRKHYRKRSIKLHPDRNGEHMRPIFEEFTDTRGVLSDVKLRQSYLRGMLDVFKCVGTGTTVMSESHDAWNKKHRPDKAEGDVRRRGDAGPNNEGKPLKLEGGLHQQVPKGVMVHHRRDGRKNHVSVSINVLKPIHEFYARVRKLRVEMKSTAAERHVIELRRSEIVNNIKYDRQGPILSNEIPVVEMSLNPGHWEVFWYATLDTVSTDPLNPQNATLSEITTRSSATTTLHVVDYDSLKKADDFHLAENSCKVIKGELANTLHKLRTNQVDSASMVNTPARYGHYHQILVRARKKCSNLLRLMNITGKSSSVHDSLSALLVESRQVFAELEDKADAAKKRKEKKDDVKRFKAYIASVLESDDPCSWMKDIIEAVLYQEGGDVNRLYQLFVEGKGKYVLMVDSEMYKEASLREDIFSTKQCKDLAAKGEEAATLEAKEEEEAAAAEEKRKKEEEEREKLQKEAELREKWALVGQNATINGLMSEKGKSLNNQMARIMYYVVDRDRFEVQPYEADEKVYLKRDNLTPYYGHVPKKHQTTPNSGSAKVVMPPASSSVPKTGGGAWNCNKCTFENDDASTECSICKSQKQQPVVVVEEKDEKQEEVDNGPTNMTTALPPAKRVDSSPKVDDSLKKTIYVKSSHSKKLTGKRGRKKKDLVKKSGAQDIQIENPSAIGKQPSALIPVHLTGSRLAVLKAIALIQEAVGMENVTESPPPPPAPPVAPTEQQKGKRDVPVVKAPAPVAPALVEKKPVVNVQQPSTSFFSGFSKPVDNLANGINHVSLSETETQPTSQYSFGDALLPHGLMDSVSTPSTRVPPELPSEIGINSSQEMARESITEASVSSLNRSSASVYSNFTLNENDPLLVFLRSQKQCIKGSVDEFYFWLVKSEDIDSMQALKEAVADDDYLNDSLKIGNGSCGLKGFKRKAFQRAVSEYEEPKTTKTVPPQTHNPAANDTYSMPGMNSSAFLPSNLFGSDDPNPSSVTNLNDPPEDELVCPIGLVLMTVDPVLAADGVTYERAFIENWFQTNMANIQMGRGIRSPSYGTTMKNLTLTPNTSIRNMARAYKERKEGTRF